MDKLKYAEIVIKEVHSKTILGQLQWKDDRRYVRAQPTPSIKVTIEYRDNGPDAATWETVFITYPVGSGETMIGSPSARIPGACDFTAAGEMLDQLNEIFRRVLLDPRKLAFEDEMKKLHAS